MTVSFGVMLLIRFMALKLFENGDDLHQTLENSCQNISHMQLTYVGREFRVSLGHCVEAKRGLFEHL